MFNVKCGYVEKKIKGTVFIFINVERAFNIFHVYLHFHFHIIHLTIETSHIVNVLLSK